MIVFYNFKKKVYIVILCWLAWSAVSYFLIFKMPIEKFKATGVY